jgi:ATP-dependent DNA helicase RecG
VKRRRVRPQLTPRSLSPRAFWRRFGRLEHERLEFKRSANRLQDSIVAMAMSSGGVILVGVADDRRLVGCGVDQRVLDQIAVVAHEIQVDVGIELLRVSRTPLLAVVVPPVADRVVTTSDGRILRRLGACNQPLRGDAVARFVRARYSAATSAESSSSTSPEGLTVASRS